MKISTESIPIFLLAFIGQTNTTATTISMDEIVAFFIAIAPVLLFLAVISMLFGFLRTISGKGGLVFSTVLIGLIGTGFLVPIAYAVPSVYYVQVPSSGWYNVQGSYSVVDPYGDEIESCYASNGGWMVNGTTFYAPSSGLFYLIPSSREDTLACMGSYKLSIGDFTQYRTFGNESDDYYYFTEMTSFEQTYGPAFSDIAASFNYSVYAKVISVNNQYGHVYRLGYNIYAFFYPINISVMYTINIINSSGFYPGYQPKLYIDVDGTTVFVGAGNGTASIAITKGYHTLRVYFRWNSYYGDGNLTGEFNASTSVVFYALKDQPPTPTTLYPSQIDNVMVEKTNGNAKVYVSDFTIVSDDDQEFKTFVVPVNTSEVKMLTVLNPVVYEYQTDTVRPARLVSINGVEFIVFQSWSNGTNNSYSIIWNYPQAAPYSNIFVDEFKSDPLLAWNDQRVNVSMVQYVNRSIVVSGDNYRYVLGRDIPFQAGSGFAYADAERAFLWVGNESFPALTFSSPSPFLMFDRGNLYYANVSDSQTSISMMLKKIVSVGWEAGETIGVVVEGNGSAVISGVIAFYDTCGYNVSVSKEIDRRDFNLSKYRIGNSIESARGYWTHMVQLVVYYDPTMLPPSDSFNVRIVLPEQEWVSSGLAKPGLADIAIVYDGNVIPFWVEPYRQPDGGRGVWLKLPADQSRNMFVISIYLNNSLLEASLSTPSAFQSFYSSSYGLGESWSVDDWNFTVTNSIYTNTIVVVPSSDSFAVKMGISVLDFYKVSPHGIFEVHSASTVNIANFSGFFQLQATHWFYYSRDGSLVYYEGSSLMWSIDGLNKDFTWPPIVVGARDASFIGLATLVPYSYSLGTVSGGSFQQHINIINDTSHRTDWKEASLALIPFVIVLIALKLAQNPPSLSRQRRNGLL